MFACTSHSSHLPFLLPGTLFPYCLHPPYGLCLFQVQLRWRLPQAGCPSRHPTTPTYCILSEQPSFCNVTVNSLPPLPHRKPPESKAVPVALQLQLPGQGHWRLQGACWKCRISGPTSGPLNQNLHFSKIPQKICMPVRGYKTLLLHSAASLGYSRWQAFNKSFTVKPSLYI